MCLDKVKPEPGLPMLERESISYYRDKLRQQQVALVARIYETPVSSLQRLKLIAGAPNEQLFQLKPVVGSRAVN
jgi:hypothetical protein